MSSILSKRKIARINLTDQSYAVETIPEHYSKNYLGGRGLNMVYLYQILSDIGKVDAYDSRNPLIFGTGMLTGTGAPSSSRMNVTTISPESQVFCDSNMGGFFPTYMRYSGFDMLIITGKAKNPVYLHLKDGKIDFQSADWLWGKTVSKTQMEINDKIDPNAKTACIGPAGENLVNFACIINGLKNAAGRGGSGAVMGSKNLKAVVASGGSGVPIAEPVDFFDTVQKQNDHLAKSKIIKTLGIYGTPLLYNVSNLIGAIRTKNSTLNSFSAGLNAEEIHEFVDTMVSCSNCLVHCRHRNTEPMGDLKYGEGPEYSTIGLMGANIGIGDAKEVIQLNNIVNDLGLDASSTGSILAWFYELFESGIITKEHSGGLDLSFGNYENTINLIHLISTRTDFGDVVADGRHATQKLSKLTGTKITEDLIIAVKGLPQSDPHDVRYIKSFSLGIATSTRGADHLRSRPTLDILTNIPDEVINKLYRATIKRSPSSYESKEHLVYFSENIFATEDCLGLCRFICQGFNSPNLLDYSHFKELIRYAVGMDQSEDELEEVGKRVINLERWINQKFFNIGFESDTLPKRYFDEPMPIED
ncbi:MAG: aldehyde ferredoxin oxidoreductase family protein, partial [Candidatus Heimdallarchaeota archaeon]